MSAQENVISILIDVLQLNDSVAKSLNTETQLLGSIPEFDSMAVVTVLTALEEEYGFFVDDDEIDAEIFETVGSLISFVDNKVG
jgi:acyl carrier protein